MKKILFLTLIFCLSAVAAFAQIKMPDYSGEWSLDTVKSKLDERMRVESMTLTVTQTDKELTTVTTTKRVIPADGGGGMNRGGGMSGDGQVMKYSLEGKETEAQVGGMRAGTATLKASLEADGKLKLSSVRNVSTQMGDVTITTKETWELADEGKTLKISRNAETPRGTSSSEMVFTKKDLLEENKAMVKGEGEVVSKGLGVSTTYTSKDLPTEGQLVSGGVLNAKATTLAKPKYPSEAKEKRVSGIVSVKVLIDLEGNVVKAEAVSGEELLLAASVEAAKNSKFSPTKLNGQSVYLSGLIIYNFVP